MNGHGPAVGERAPDFTLATTGGASVTLSSFRGKQPVLLAFFPLAFTSTCTAEMCAFTDDYSAYESRGVAVIPISVDAVPSLQAWKNELSIGPELASDFRRDVARAYGVFNEAKFYADRSYFLIDRLGIVRWAYVEQINRDRRSTADLLTEIEKLPD